LPGLRECLGKSINEEALFVVPARIRPLTAEHFLADGEELLAGDAAEVIVLRRPPVFRDVRAGERQRRIEGGHVLRRPGREAGIRRHRDAVGEEAHLRSLRQIAEFRELLGLGLGLQPVERKVLAQKLQPLTRDGLLAAARGRMLLAEANAEPLRNAVADERDGRTEYQ